MTHPRLLAGALAALFLCAPAWSQAVVSHAGKWSVKWTGQRGAEREAHLDLTDSGGTYKFLLFNQRGAADPCDTRPHAVEIRRSTATELELLIERSKTLGGCTDSRLVLQKTAEGFAGSFMGGLPVKVTPR